MKFMLDAGRNTALKRESNKAENDKVFGKLPLVLKSEASERTVVKVRNVLIGGERVVVIAGPCSVESRQQVIETALAVRKRGAVMLRGGAYKPRTSPYDFQGLGVEGLKFLHEAGRIAGLPIVTEVMSEEDVELICEYADMLQIGARNMQNFALLKKVAKTGKPVLLKRGPAATVKEWLSAAEYLLHGGNPNVVLCERGIKTFDNSLRNTLDLAAVALVKEISHLPVIVDPSHATGKRSLISATARAAIAVGADGVIVEVHPCPEKSSVGQFSTVKFRGVCPDDDKSAKPAERNCWGYNLKKRYTKTKSRVSQKANYNLASYFIKSTEKKQNRRLFF
jgi:3-deoxy-7-phosphoheptulonate synthase